MKQTKLAKHWQKSSPNASRVHRKTRNVNRNPTRSSDGSGNDEPSGSAGIKSIVFVKDSKVVDDREEEESPKKSLNASPFKRRRKVHSDDERDIDFEASPSKLVDSEEDEIQSPKRRLRRKVVGSDDESQLKPKKRLTKGKRPPTPEPDDLMEELDEEVVIEPRMRQRSKPSAYQKNLEKLKKKKFGMRSSDSSDQAREGNESEGSVDNEDSDDGPTVPFAGAKPSSSIAASDEDPESGNDSQPEDSFIVEDEGADDVILPAKFSRNRHRDLSENFKILCQLMVHVALQPSAQREVYMQLRLRDDYFSIARDDIRGKMSGILDQTITSQIWKKPFLDPLKKYPNFEVEQLTTAVPSCDACHLTRRVSTRLGSLTGQPYKPLGFQYTPGHYMVSSSTDNDESSEDEEREHKEFNMGRFCARRAQLYHSFCHWEYHLFQALDEEVSTLKSSDYVRVSTKESARPPDDLTDGDGIMEWLDGRGVIERQFHILKRLMNAGQNLDRAADDDE